MTGFVAGTARADITPPVGVDLCGYGARPGASTGVRDPLLAEALYLADGRCKLLILTCDLIGFHHDQVAALRRGIEARTGVPAAHILVGCSHTHAGPATPCLKYLGNPDPAYLEGLLRTVMATATVARERAQPAQAGWARTELRVGMNRRQRCAGGMAIGVNEEGSTAPYVDVLVVNALDGGPLARLFSHAAHAVALGGDNTLISADWPGAARRGIEAAAGGGAALFLQGCCGNLNCRERGDEGVESQGRAAAAAVLAAVAKAGLSERVTLGAALTPLDLPLAPPPPAAEARALVAAARAKLAELPATANRGVRWMAEGAVEWSLDLLRLAEEGPRARTVPFAVQALRVGAGAIVGLPGEVFVEYALNLDRASLFQPTLVAGYANGNVGYIPTAAAYPEGGYEVTDAIRYYGVTMPLPESEALILAAARTALSGV
jgi:hypothetical protein